MKPSAARPAAKSAYVSGSGMGAAASASISPSPGENGPPTSAVTRRDGEEVVGTCEVPLRRPVVGVLHRADVVDALGPDLGDMPQLAGGASRRPPRRSPRSGTRTARTARSRVRSSSASSHGRSPGWRSRPRGRRGAIAGAPTRIATIRWPRRNRSTPAPSAAARARSGTASARDCERLEHAGRDGRREGRRGTATPSGPRGLTAGRGGGDARRDRGRRRRRARRPASTSSTACSAAAWSPAAWC